MKGQKKSLPKSFAWLNWLSLGLLFLLFLSFFSHNLTAFTQDLGRHLKVSELIVQTGKVPKTNLFSFAFPQFPFINHHWLPEVIFFLINQAFGLNALILLKIILGGLAFFSLLAVIHKRLGWNTSLAWGFLMLLLFKQRTAVRPEIFSFLFLSIYLIILNRRQYFQKWSWVLPLIQLLWINTHIYFFLGPSLLFFYLLDQAISFKLKKKALTRPLLVFLLSSLACLVNPNFLQGALYPLRVFENYGYQIVENQSFFFMTRYFGKIYKPYFLFIFLISLISFGLTLKKQTFYRMVSFLFFSFLGFQAIRNIPIFALGIFILAAPGLSLIKKEISDKLKLPTVASFMLLFYLLFIPVNLSLIYQNISNQTYKSKFSNKRFGFGQVKGASAGTDFILKNKISGPLFNNFDIGSFLIFRLYPQYQVFVDGRPEAYPADFFKQVYIPMQSNEETWRQVDEVYNFNFIFFSHTDITPWAIQFLRKTSQAKDWQLVFLDDYVMIFLKKNQQNQPLIKKLALKKESFYFSCQREVDCLARMKNALRILGW